MKNLADPSVVREILNANSFNFSKSLGQNFLIDESVLDNIIEKSGIEDAYVLEIGPGFGTLTQRLCSHAKKVVAVEIDSSVIPILKDNLKECDNLKVIHADIMKTDIKSLIQKEFGGNKVKVCANLPYYITSPIIMNLLSMSELFYDITVMIQKEVAHRINALPSSKDYGVLTLSVGYYATSEIIDNVPPSSFMPPPKVSSSVIKLTMRDEPPVYVKDTKLYFDVIKASFALRRKTLLNALSAGLGIGKDEIARILNKVGIDATRRGETLSDREFSLISNEIGDSI